MMESSRKQKLFLATHSHSHPRLFRHRVALQVLYNGNNFANSLILSQHIMTRKPTILRTPSVVRISEPIAMLASGEQPGCTYLHSSRPAGGPVWRVGRWRKRVGGDHSRHLGGVLYHQPCPLQKNGLAEGEEIKLQSFRFPHQIRGKVQSDIVWKHDWRCIFNTRLSRRSRH